MATRRARFKPVLSQAARRGRPGAPDGQPVEGAKELVTPDESNKNLPSTPNQKASSAVKPEVLSSLVSKNAPPDGTDGTDGTESNPLPVLKSNLPSNAPENCAEESVGKEHPAKVSSLQPSKTPVASRSKQDAAPAPAELPQPLPPPRPPTPVSGPSEPLSNLQPAGDISSPAKNDSSARSSKDERKETAPSVKRRQPSTTNQRALTARRNFMKLSKDGPPARSSLTMFDLIFYNPVTNPMTNKSPPPAKSRDRKASICSVSSIHEQRLSEEKVDDVDDSQMKESEDKENKEEEEEPAVPVPRVKVGPDGRIVIDEQSLVIETTETKKTRAEMEKAEVVFDTGLSNGFYKRSKRSKDWSHRETLKFYRALHVYGTDFSLMQVLFKDRTRKELKLKFKKEERMRGHLIDKALISPLDFDTTELEKEALEEEEEEAARLAKEKEEKEKPKPKPAKAKRNSCSLAKKEMSGQSCSELDSLDKPPKKKKVVRKPTVKPAAKPKADVKRTVSTALDIFGDVVLPTDPVPSTSTSKPKKAANASAPKKRKAPPRDPSQPPKKIKKKNVILSPESDHSYAASPTNVSRTNRSPVHKTPNVKKRVKADSRNNNNGKVQSPGYVTIDLSNHVIITPERTVGVSPNEFSPQYATLRTPKTPVNVNITQSAGLPPEFGSPGGPAPNRAVPVPITGTASHSASNGPIVPIEPATKIEPGSLYVLQTKDPNDPKRSVFGVYMVTNSQPKVSTTPFVESPKLVEDAVRTPSSEPLIVTIKGPGEDTVLTKL